MNRKQKKVVIDALVADCDDALEAEEEQESRERVLYATRAGEVILIFDALKKVMDVQGHCLGMGPGDPTVTELLEISIRIAEMPARFAQDEFWQNKFWQEHEPAKHYETLGRVGETATSKGE